MNGVMKMKQKVSWINWRRIIVIFLVFVFILLVIYLSFMYRSIMHSKSDGLDETKEIVSTSLDLNVDEVYHFQEELGYHIAFASDAEDEDWIVFVPLEEEIKKEDFIVMEANSVLSQEEIENNWLSDCNSCQLIKSGPAMIDQIPLWELTYKDSSNRYVIEYVTLKDGSIYEQLRLHRKYSERG